MFVKGKRQIFDKNLKNLRIFAPFAKIYAKLYDSVSHKLPFCQKFYNDLSNLYCKNALQMRFIVRFVFFNLRIFHYIVANKSRQRLHSHKLMRFV